MTTVTSTKTVTTCDVCKKVEETIGVFKPYKWVEVEFTVNGYSYGMDLCEECCGRCNKYIYSTNTIRNRIGEYLRKMFKIEKVK